MNVVKAKNILYVETQCTSIKKRLWSRLNWIYHKRLHPCVPCKWTPWSKMIPRDFCSVTMLTFICYTRWCVMKSCIYNVFRYFGKWAMVPLIVTKLHAANYSQWVSALAFVMPLTNGYNWLKWSYSYSMTLNIKGITGNANTDSHCEWYNNQQFKWKTCLHGKIVFKWKTGCTNTCAFSRKGKQMQIALRQLVSGFQWSKCDAIFNKKNSLKLEKM